MKLTVIIIFSPDGDKKDLERARRSVGWADEVMVVEVPETIRDFSRARNEALQRVKGEWVMFVDADEEISEGLKKEILKTTDKSYKDYKNYNISGAYFRRSDRFLGRWLKHGETAGVRLLRLGRKDAGRWERPVHEVWKIGGRIGEFEHPIWHYSHQSVDAMVEKLDGYSEIEAEYRLRQGDRWINKINRLIDKWVVGFQLVFFPAGKFVQNYFWRLGFLDGMEGLIHALMMSGHSLLVRGKILERS